MSTGDENVTETLVERLSENLKPVHCLAHPLRRVFPWMAAAVVYVGAVIFMLGVRADLPMMLREPHFLFELGLMMAVSLSAFLSSAWLCVPDMRGVKGMLAVPLTLFGVFMFWHMVRGVSEEDVFGPIHWGHCMLDSLLMGLFPAAGVSFLCRGGTTTCPRMMAVINLLAVAALAYVGVRLTCPLDTVAHAALSHLLPFILLGAVLGGVARRLYRW